ncbi:hypothetical protein [Methylococcus geothermalis]|uniref:Uncharacterized protein n=1 Tax=Methylococcus geothermalis TaxID=2681310 RepID=A0A858Q481_9GAMM|nr:hypothetical protein [Methylococcus geothermalis]QJD28652.1 hypothetical protein GNH96_00835 [Methylococcus geothermalis]
MTKQHAAIILILASMFPTPSVADDSARCYAIRDADRRNACLAETRDAKSYCYSIKDADRRNICLAETTGERSRCYSIRDKDVRASCLAGMGW